MPARPQASASKLANPRAYREASDEIWVSGDYRGIAAVRELDFDGNDVVKANSRFPLMKVGVVGWIQSADGSGHGRRQGAGAPGACCRRIASAAGTGRDGGGLRRRGLFPAAAAGAHAHRIRQSLQPLLASAGWRRCRTNFRQAAAGYFHEE